MSKTNSWKSFLPKDFESASQVSKMQKNIVKALSKGHSSKTSRTLRTTLAETLTACSKQKPCLNEACPKCRRKYRKSLLKAFTNNELQHGVWTRVSVIPDGLFSPYRKLHAVDLKTIIKRLNKNIQRSELSDAIIIGGIDISLNIFENTIQGWQLHLYFLINRPITDDLKKSIKSTFKKGAIKTFSFRQIEAEDQRTLHQHMGAAVTYMYKNGFNRRSQYYERRLKTDKSQRLNVRSQPLKLDQLATISAWLGKYNVGDRLLLHNVKRSRAAPLSVKFSVHGELVKQSLSPQKRKTKSKDINGRPRNHAATPV